MTPHLYTDCVQRDDFRKHLFESGTFSILLCPMPRVVFSKCGCRQSWGLSLFPMRKSSCRTCLLSHLQLVPASPQPHQPHWSPIVCVTYSVMSDSLCLMDCSTWFLGSWNSPGKNTGVGSHSLLQGIFLIQGLNPGFLSVGRFFIIWATREA